jgi:hypothetical protein
VLTARRGRRRTGTGLRLLVVAVGSLLALPLATAPAAADPAGSGPSVIGTGNVVPDDEYIDSANPDADVDATAGPTVDNGCTMLAGAARHPQPADAKAFCAQAANQCAVVVVWQPKVRTPQRPERSPQRKLGAFDHWLDFTPELATSPTDQDGLIARLPTWVWDRNTADIRGICLPIYGGVCGFAVRLGTTWKTEGRTFCRNSGREYRPGSDDPTSASGCSWTYARQGGYGVTGCKNWLIVVWRLPWYIPIVFPLELCNTDQVGVQESQVLAGSRDRTVEVN